MSNAAAASSSATRRATTLVVRRSGVRDLSSGGEAGVHPNAAVGAQRVRCGDGASCAVVASSRTVRDLTAGGEAQACPFVVDVSGSGVRGLTSRGESGALPSAAVGTRHGRCGVGTSVVTVRDLTSGGATPVAAEALARVRGGGLLADDHCS